VRQIPYGRNLGSLDRWWIYISNKFLTFSSNLLKQNITNWFMPRKLLYHSVPKGSYISLVQSIPYATLVWDGRGFSGSISQRNCSYGRNGFLGLKIYSTIWDPTAFACNASVSNPTAACTILPSKQIPWPESASELYRSGDRSLSPKLVPSFAERAVSRIQRGGSLTELLSCTHEVQWIPFQTHHFSENLVARGIEPGPLDLYARNSNH
jgi:hypothetical protein